MSTVGQRKILIVQIVPLSMLSRIGFDGVRVIGTSLEQLVTTLGQGEDLISSQHWRLLPCDALNTWRQCLESACLSYVLLVPVANWLARGAPCGAPPNFVALPRCAKSCSSSTSSASVIRTLGSQSVASPHVGFSMVLDCLACPQRGFVLKFVPKWDIRQGRHTPLG